MAESRNMVKNVCSFTIVGYLKVKSHKQAIKVLGMTLSNGHKEEQAIIIIQIVSTWSHKAG